MKTGEEITGGLPSQKRGIWMREGCLPWVWYWEKFPARRGAWPRKGRGEGGGEACYSKYREGKFFLLPEGDQCVCCLNPAVGRKGRGAQFLKSLNNGDVRPSAGERRRGLLACWETERRRATLSGGVSGGGGRGGGEGGGGGRLRWL